MERIGAATALALMTALSAFAQSAEHEVRKLNDAMIAAGQAGDKAGYAKMVSDDLRWVDIEGVMLSKTQRLASITGGPVPKFSEVDIKVYGDVAVMMARADFPDGRKARNHRVFVKRGGQWQLVSHSGTALK